MEGGGVWMGCVITLPYVIKNHCELDSGQKRYECIDFEV